MASVITPLRGPALPVHDADATWNNLTVAIGHARSHDDAPRLSPAVAFTAVVVAVVSSFPKIQRIPVGPMCRREVMRRLAPADPPPIALTGGPALPKGPHKATAPSRAWPARRQTNVIVPRRKRAGGVGGPGGGGTGGGAVGAGPHTQAADAGGAHHGIRAFAATVVHIYCWSREFEKTWRPSRPASKNFPA